MNHTFTYTIRDLACFAGLLCAAVLFIAMPAPAAAADDAATAVFGPTIDNVPWEYIPAWYKSELLASGYQAPLDPALPPVLPPPAVTQVYGPTIANVPWEYVPDWYKAELAAADSYRAPVATLEGPTTELPSLIELEETEMDEASAASESVSDTGGESDSVAEDAVAEAGSFMSETSFFFLCVFLILVILILVSAAKNRSRAQPPAAGS